jgi:hypothetical protein
MISIPSHYYGVIIGLILSDAWIIFASKNGKNARLRLEQSLAHFAYFWPVFTIFHTIVQVTQVSELESDSEI